VQWTGRVTAQSATPHRARVRIESRPAAPEGALPRMDVAAFVGFAAMGPLHVPTRIESFARFEAIFGGELPLAWDPARGGPVRALLRAAVRAFFDNGGERCWVVRVARPVEPSTFPLPGVIALAPPDAAGGRAAFAQARSQGSWSDGVMVSSALQAFPLHVTGWSPGEGWIALAPTSGRELEAWDLIRLRFADTSLEAMLFAGGLQVDERPPGAPRSDAIVRALAGDGGLLWLSPEPPSAAIAAARAFDLPAPGLPLLPGAAWEAGGVRVPLALRPGDAPAPGSVIALDLEGGGEPVWLTVVEVSADPQDPGQSWLAGPIRRRVAPPATLPARPATAERLTLELWSRAAGGQLARAADLGFHPRHRRAWMSLATDEEIHGGEAMTHVEQAPHGQATAPPRAGLAPAAFPLAGRDRNRVTLPIGVRDVPAVCLGARLPAGAGSPLERDGLDAYDERLFVDPALADTPHGALVAAAERICDLGPTPRRLRGMHPLLSIDEVTLIAIPDAVHAGWSRAASIDTPAAAGAPQPQPAPGFCVEPDAALGWRVSTAAHRALLRLCAARGDALAVLALPCDTREEDALRYAGELRGLTPPRFAAPPADPVPLVPPLTSDERGVASYGALYHPWVVSRADAAAPPAAVPPVGAVTGAIAGHARSRGPWAAPTGQPLAGVLGLVPGGAERTAELDAGAINVLQGEPRGYLAASQWTLGTGGDVREIHVRRLLAMLKRAARRLGERYVFARHSRSLRRAVERAFGELLGRLYHGGAFADATPAQTYEVRAGSPRDAPAAGEQGRIVVELCVAPERPLERFTLRLVERRDGTLTVEED